VETVGLDSGDPIWGGRGHGRPGRGQPLRQPRTAPRRPGSGNPGRARHDLYQKAREANPLRWTGNTRDWKPVSAVTLNPERDSVVQACGQATDKMLSAAW